MVAYSFKKQFSPRIEDGTKTGTIRAARKRHARVGERLQLFEAMRTKHCRKIIQDPVCVSVKPIQLHINEHEVAFVRLGLLAIVELPEQIYDAFACGDGFDDMTEMHRFWLQNHGTGIFKGFWIQWKAPIDHELMRLVA